MLVPIGKRSMLTLFPLQIQLHLLNWFTIGEKHRLFLWRLIRETSWSFWTDWQEQKEAWEGRGREETTWLGCITTPSVSDGECHFAVSGCVIGKGCSLWVTATDLEGWRLWDTQDKIAPLMDFFFFLHHLALRASLCPWILLFQPGDLLSWQPQLPSLSPCWCWEKPEVGFSLETALAEFS